MRSRILRLMGTTILICSLSAVCGCGLTLGPVTKTEYVLVHPGKPLVVLENKAVKARVLDGSGDAVKQDVGGWVMMPPEHWEAVKRKLEK